MTRPSSIPRRSPRRRGIQRPRAAALHRPGGSSGPERRPPAYESNGVEDEELHRDVLLRVHPAHEGPHPAVEDPLDGGAELRLGGVLEEEAHIAQTGMLSHRRHVALGRRERLPQLTDQRVGPGPVRSRPGGPAAELLLVELHHRPRELGERIVLTGLGLVEVPVLAHRAHLFPRPSRAVSCCEREEGAGKIRRAAGPG